MLVLHDPQCADYSSYMRPEQPGRVTKSVAHLQAAHPDWAWQVPTLATTELEAAIALAHAPALSKRLAVPRDIDEDTPYFPGIGDHARRSVAAALAAARHAVTARTPVFSLMRPPGHHATADQAMGFCYLNQVAVAALAAQASMGAKRVAVWDFDAHHGNGTEAILRDREDVCFASVHQSPGYPDTGTASRGNCHNWPIAPRSPREVHVAALRESFETIVAFRPDLLLVSAGFDAFREDPITSMTLEINDFSTLGTWLGESRLPAAGVLEGGYSHRLPVLIDAFLSAWVSAAE